MADITIHDVLAWEPRLQLMRRPLPGASSAEDVGERDVSWAVTVRAAAPMLNPLRGGELVLLPDRVLAESGLALPVLLRELVSHNVSAAVVETLPSIASAVPLLIAPELSVEFETELNRLLTERRGELYRAGTELGRALSGTGLGTDLGSLLRIASISIGCSIAVMDPRGTILERVGADAIPSGAARSAQTMLAQREWRDNRLIVKLHGGDVIWLGPVSRDNRALVRLASDRIAIAVEGVLQRSVDERPRGAARATALNSLLLGSEDTSSRTGPLLGLSPDGLYRVALVSQSTDIAALQRALSTVGAAHEAGVVDGTRALVIQLRIEAGEGRRTGNRMGARALSRALATSGADWIAVSRELAGVEHIPTGARQARYVALLIQRGVIPPGSVQFDRLPEIGIFQ